MQQRRTQQKIDHDQRAKKNGNSKSIIWYTLESSKEWIPGQISKVFGPLSYEIRLSDGTNVRCHIDQESNHQPTHLSDWMVTPVPPPAVNNPAPEPDRSPPPRRSSRISHPPDRHGHKLSELNLFSSRRGGV